MNIIFSTHLSTDINSINSFSHQELSGVLHLVCLVSLCHYFNGGDCLCCQEVFQVSFEKC